MLDFIKGPSPQYKGTSTQPKNGGGLLAQILCYLFGGGTPTYKGNGQPVAKGCGVPGFPSTPVYKTPVIVNADPIETPALESSADVEADHGDVSGQNGSLRASDPTTKGPITIVIG